MTSPTHRTHAKPQKRKAHLVDCAEALFAQKGYEATTIADVITMAGVSKGGFYHHFGSKEALLEALAERLACRALAGLEAIQNDPLLDPFARFDAILKHLRMQKTELSPELIRTFEVVFRPDNAALYNRIRLITTGVVEPILSRAIAEGVADGTFNVPDPESCARIILHLNAALHDPLVEVLAERDRGENGPARERLHRMVRMQGLAIDRLLGLPDDSVILIEPAEVDQMLGLGG